MKKIFAFVIFISLIIFGGCGVKDGDKDTHYKPEEFKHNVAISNANRTMRDIDFEIVAMGAETSADIVYETYNDSIAKLKQELTTLENTKKQLSEDKELSKSEISSWTYEYDKTIKGVQNSIKSVETKLAEFLK